MERVSGKSSDASPLSVTLPVHLLQFRENPRLAAPCLEARTHIREPRPQRLPGHDIPTLKLFS